MPRLGVIELSQLPAFQVLEILSSDAIINARMQQLVAIWAHTDPPNMAQYDVDKLEFDPIRINQECSAYFETLMRDRVNQACRAVTLAFAVGGNLDAIGSRYPGGMPRLTDETDDAYRTRIWLSPNTLSPNGLYESYVFYGFTAAALLGTPLRDCQVLSTPGTPKVAITIMADGLPIIANISDGVYDGTFRVSPSPTPSNDLISGVYEYIIAPNVGRKGLTDVVNVNGPKIRYVDYKVRIILYPGWDINTAMQSLYPALAALLDSQRYLGFSHTRAAIDAALKVSGVFNVLIDSPVADVIISTDSTVMVRSVILSYGGRGGFGPPSPSA